MERIVFFDNMKGFAVFLVVWGHVYYYIYDDGSSTIPTICHFLQIPIFIFVGGVFSSKPISRNSIMEIIKSKSIRLLLPFLSIGTLWILFCRIPFTEFIFDEFKYGYWFTYVLFEIFVLCYILSYSAKQISINKYFLYILFYIALTLLIKTQTLPAAIINGFSLNLLWHYFPFFIIGQYYNEHAQIINQTTNNKYLLYISFFLFITGYYIYRFCLNNAGLVLAHFSGLLLVFIIFSRYHFPTTLSKALSLWGKYSLEIYLLQYFLLHILQHTFISEIRNEYYQSGLNLIICLAIIYLCIGFARYVSKSQILSFLLFGNQKQV